MPLPNTTGIMLCHDSLPTIDNFYQSPLIVTDLFQNNLINVSYLTTRYFNQVMMLLHFLMMSLMTLNQHKNKEICIVASLKSVQKWVN